ncbi:unnamed protein product [Trichobilharzia regenti]|nr:unnamed protein product [Trichobilharzia regenti]
MAIRSRLLSFIVPKAQIVINPYPLNNPSACTTTSSSNSNNNKYFISNNNDDTQWKLSALRNPMKEKMKTPSYHGLRNAESFHYV